MMGGAGGRGMLWGRGTEVDVDAMSDVCVLAGRDRCLKLEVECMG
jgi:hypothetical protein